MSIRATRGVRLLLTVAMLWVGLAIGAQPASAWVGKIQVAKVNQGGNPNDSFAFHPSFYMPDPQAGDFSLKGGQASQPYEVYCNVAAECEGNSASLAVTEQATSGYTLTDITCRHTQGDSNNYAGAPTASSPVKPDSEVTKNLAGGTVSLTLHLYEWVLCTYTNTYTPATSPPPPSGCTTSDVVVARVTGRRIVRVTFYVDNKKVKTLHQANRGRQWVLSMRIRGLAFGSHRVKAKVEFAKSSQTKAKTLPLSFSRCRSAATRPQFTG